MGKVSIAESLLKIKAVSLSLDPPFTWVSGIKSPIYCDNRLFISYVDERRKVVDAFIEKITNSGLEFNVIAGTATSAIPFAAWISEKLSLPMVYVRAQKKEHGKGKSVEGRLEKGSRVIVIEDLISTGKSSVQVVKNLREEGAEVVGVFSIFSYQFKKADDNFKSVGLSYQSLENIESLLQHAVEKNYLSQRDADIINEFRKDPENWYSTYFKGE
ncbi:orotate phosphoribosyltransferase [Thermotomaculum hydrothermale]|uniref:Orotate phosphoribosyltransferase n=1 Tax=Thermotomaculum hydrothermale TaxID=981385 RepID=A0A7R6PS44_9BACT|nr:orotate phosphoribosyltransferase [Thermotomaculum hydrothermale]BBB33341.1 orotate phosphoribosyltransferase [Thermotomaculum hydrothermale]